MLLIGYFEGLDVERAIAWQVVESGFHHGLLERRYRGLLNAVVTFVFFAGIVIARRAVFGAQRQT